MLSGCCAIAQNTGGLYRGERCSWDEQGAEASVQAPSLDPIRRKVADQEKAATLAKALSSWCGGHLGGLELGSVRSKLGRWTGMNY